MASSSLRNPPVEGPAGMSDLIRAHDASLEAIGARDED
jgi:hypothetical protein